MDAAGVKAHPSFFVDAWAFSGAALTLGTFRLGLKVSLLQRQRKRRILGSPPTFLREVQLLKAYFNAMLLAELFKPYIGDTEPVHDVVSMRETAVENLVIAPCDSGE